MTSCQDIRKCRKCHKRCKASKRRNMQKESGAEMQKIGGEIDRNKDRFRHLSGKVDKKQNSC